jgi:PBP1b-binding outer membrane lipoprotein LpoB
MIAKVQKIAVVALVLVLAGCAGSTEVKYVKPITFAGEPPIRLNVAKIEVVDDYVPPMRLPNVEHAAPTPPYTAVRQWANERLQAVGTTGYAQVLIEDAHITQRRVGEAQTEYSGRINVIIEAHGADFTQPAATAEVTVQRALTTDQDKSLADKEGVWDQLVRLMMTDFDNGMSGAITANMGGFVPGGGAAVTAVGP